MLVHILLLFHRRVKLRLSELFHQPIPYHTCKKTVFQADALGFRQEADKRVKKGGKVVFVDEFMWAGLKEVEEERPEAKDKFDYRVWLQFLTDGLFEDHSRPVKLIAEELPE